MLPFRRSPSRELKKKVSEKKEEIESVRRVELKGKAPKK